VPAETPAGATAEVWDREIAEAYDASTAPMFAPGVLGPAVEKLFELARGGPVLEFAVGTGRVALPLSARGVDVHGIELSPHMVEQLRRKPGAGAVAVTVGDMAHTRVPGSFTLVYLVFNTIMNVTTQRGQVAVFENASAHLAPGGRFVVEVVVPRLQAFGPGTLGRVSTLEPDHVGIERLDDPVAQIASSHHWMVVDGRLVRHTAPFRYVWPAELELMGRFAGLELHERWAWWDGAPFTHRSPQQVAVFEKPP